MLKTLFSLKEIGKKCRFNKLFLYIEKVMESSTLSLSNTINLELHGIFAQRDHFPFIWTLTFTQYKLTIHPPSCQLTIEFIALLNDNCILRCVIVSIAMLFLCTLFLIFIIVPQYNRCFFVQFLCFLLLGVNYAGLTETNLPD